MGNELQVIEKQLNLLAPNFEQVLAAYKMPVERLMRTVVVSVERLPKLLECNRQSILNSAMTAATLGLEVDGVTGQGFLIPFKGKAQFIPGYKGYNTMAARSGYTLNAAVVREGDEFDFQLGSDAFIHHKPKLGDERQRKILGAYAVATMPGRRPIIQPMSIDEILAIKQRAPGGNKQDSPWNDALVGFPAMAAKTAKRRLARDMPLNTMVMAAGLEDQLDLGRTAHITPEKGIIIDSEGVDVQQEPTTPPTWERDKFKLFFTSLGKEPAERPDINAYKAAVVAILDKATPDQLRMFRTDNKKYIEGLIERGYGEQLGSIYDRLANLED
jgi:recombination protein RecT